jgi:hypothetical protein
VALKAALAYGEQLVALPPVVGLSCRIREKPRRQVIYEYYILAIGGRHSDIIHTIEGQREAGHSKSSHDQELAMQ